MRDGERKEKMDSFLRSVFLTGLFFFALAFFWRAKRLKTGGKSKYKDVKAGMIA